MMTLAPFAVLVITFCFSMLGMSGGQLIIPVLFWLGLDFKSQAIPTGLLCAAVSATSAAFTYIRTRQVNWAVGLPFMIAILVGPPLGAATNARLPAKPIIAAFAAFTAFAAILMLSGWRPRTGALSRRAQWAVGLFGGLGLGFLVGLIGRGGGSFVVPLLIICGLDPKTAAATSAVIVTGSNWVGFLSHLRHAQIPPAIAAISAIAALVGSQLGSNFMVRRLDRRQVRKAFGVLLLIVAGILLVKDVIL